MEGELFQGGVLMHSYLRAVGFSRITKRSSIRQIITDVGLKLMMRKQS